MQRLILCLMVTLVVFGGCSSEPPPPDKVKLEQEAKQLQEHRQKEWGETPAAPK